MVTQEVELKLAPSALLAACQRQSFAFSLDGGGAASWGCGQAWLGFGPRAILHVWPTEAATVHSNGKAQRWDGDPIELLERFRATYPSTATVVALSYELRHWIEDLPRRAVDDMRLPVLYAAAYDWLLVYSYATQRYELISADSRFDFTPVRAKLHELSTAPPPASHVPTITVTSDFSKETYIEAVRRVLDYIAAGDLYQVNLAQRFSGEHADLSAAALHAALQAQDAMPYGAYLYCGGFSLVSNSPECLLTLRGDRLATFPIKGTRPRGATESADLAQILSLQNDAKERAEHVMIVDLERNDLGRVCRIGSVDVTSLAQVVTFPHLHHMVSEVIGQRRPEVTLGDILRATFPGGSITGAPKIRAMEIIDEIEPVQRGFYTGSIGIVMANGDATFNIAIRTGTVLGDRVVYHAGGGIVADSKPEAEYTETLLKARSFLNAVGASDES